MSLLLAAEAPPLTSDEHGTVRIRGSRVMLDLIVRDMQRGLKAEEIAGRYDTLELADVYSILAYCLRHSREIADYMARREAEAAELRSRVEREQPPFPRRHELLARTSGNSTRSLA